MAMGSATVLSVVLNILMLRFGQATLDGPIDLSWAYDEQSVFWPNTNSFKFTKRVAEISANGYWYAMNEFCTGEHGGTHFDAPYHFNRYGMKVGDVPLSKLIAPGICIDVQSKTRLHGFNATLTKEDILSWELAHGVILKESIVLINFGWSQHYRSDNYLYDFEKKLAFPGISPEAAQLLADRRVNGVGLDTASVDPGKCTHFQAHRTLAKNDIYGLENVKIPNNFPAVGFKLFVLPMKIMEGTGAPVRIVAMPDHILQFPRSEMFKIESGTFWIRNSWVVLLALLLVSMYFIHSFSL